MKYDFLPLTHVSQPEYLKMAEQTRSREAPVESYLRFMKSGEHNLAVESWSCPAFEISAAAREGLLYPEVFAILSGGPDYSTRRASLDAHELRFTLEGSGELEYRGRRYALNPGDGYWINCREPHAYRTTGDVWKCTILHFNGHASSLMFEEYAKDGGVTFSDAAFPTFEAMQEQMLRATLDMSAAGQFRVSCAMDALLTELIARKQSARLSAETARDMEKIAAYLQEHCTERITGDALSRRFSISRAYLSTAFKAYTGLGPTEFMIQARMGRARSLLMGSDLPVDIVAHQVGFESTSGFIHTFKQREGITPLQYRKMWK